MDLKFKYQPDDEISQLFVHSAHDRQCILIFFRCYHSSFTFSIKLSATYCFEYLKRSHFEYLISRFKEDENLSSVCGSLRLDYITVHCRYFSFADFSLQPVPIKIRLSYFLLALFLYNISQTVCNCSKSAILY